MAYQIYVKDEIANQIGLILTDVFTVDNIFRIITVDNLTINQGVAEIGPYMLPLSNILFIKEV